MRFCEKIFTKNTTLTRHIQKYCKKSNNLEKEIKELKKEIAELKTHNTQIINTHNTNNSNNCNNTNNNINIILNDFGKEDTSHIAVNFIKNLIMHMNGGSIAKMIEAVHFNNPCNLNIQIPNKKEALITIWKNDTWEVKDKDRVLDGIIVENFDRIYDVYEEIEKNLSDKVKKQYNDYADKFEKMESHERKIAKRETEIMLLNNRKKFKKRI